uniref:Uncharacterized protein n=1 Tax=Oryza sativa subsp. japonica TaxID=39947 RepID=Q5Z436_ORYSJ|nr:hypothetical protein [Oryza sativa Japonica Group]
MRATAFRRNRGQAGVEGDAATSREDGDDDSRCTGKAAQAAGGGTVAATPLFCRRGHVSGGFPAKRRADRGRGGGCDVDGGDGDVGRRTSDEQQLAEDGTVAVTPLLPAGMHFRRSPRATEGRPAQRRRLRRWRRRRHGRPALGQGGRGGWRVAGTEEREGGGGERWCSHGEGAGGG